MPKSSCTSNTTLPKELQHCCPISLQNKEHCHPVKASAKTKDLLRAGASIFAYIGEGAFSRAPLHQKCPTPLTLGGTA